MAEARRFSWAWVVVSCGVFIASELLLGRLLESVVVGHYKSMNLEFELQGLLHLASFLVGGLVVGVFSPGVRMLEPAVGAFVTIGLIEVLSFFTPYAFFQAEPRKLLVAGGIAFVLALVGAYAGERLMGNLKAE